MTASTCKIILITGIALYIVTFGALTALRHSQFETQAWDMGIFQQTLWNTTRGRIMQNTIEEIPNHLGVHMSPFLFLLVPGFALFPSPYYLLLVQTLALAAGAVPAYFLALKILHNRPRALFFAGAYLLLPPLHWVNWFDFHEIAFFVPFALAGMYYAAARRWTWAWIFLALAASTKEDAILAVAAIGAWIFFKSGNLSAPPAGRYPPKGETFGSKGLPFGFWTPERKHGAALAAASFAYFLIATQFVMPAFGGGLVRLDRYAELGETPRDILATLATNPARVGAIVFTSEKMRYLLWLFLPLAFLPLAAGRALILAIPGLLENLLTSYQSQFSGFYQYDAILIPALFVAALYGFSRLHAHWPQFQKPLFWTVGALIVVAFAARSPVSPFGFPAGLFQSSPRTDAYRAMIEVIPPAASVSAHTNLVPHLANRERVYMLGREPETTDIVLLDGGDYFGFADPDAFQTYADSYALSGLYDIRVIVERYFIFTRKNLSLPR